jgi:L-threonylcarbamoyladenylate synthase
MRAVLDAFGGPVAAPSANPSGRISPTTAQHVLDGLGGQIAAVLDGGPCAVGLESTILAPGTPSKLLREGGLAREDIEAVTGPLVTDTTPGKVQAPGQLSSHYAPSAAVVLGGPVPEGAVTIGFGPGETDLSLSQRGDLIEAAATLFATLHAADALATARGSRVIHVAPVPDTSLGRAINDRLRRAAAPRNPEISTR